MAFGHKAEGFANRLPSQTEIRSAKQLDEIFSSVGNESRLRLAEEDGSVRTVTLAPALAKTFRDMLRLVASGNSFYVIPVEAELTTRQAADILNVSRPYFVKLLEDGELPHSKVRRHRRVRAEDLFAYKARRDALREEALAAMARADADAGLV